MISSKEDYKAFLKIEHKYVPNPNFIKVWFHSFLKPQSRFLLYLRTSEYYRNCKKGIFNKVVFLFMRYLKSSKGLQLGFSIPDNTVGAGLQLPHYGTIVINSAARIGKNARIHVDVNIGASNKTWNAPQIGDNVYIAPGAKLFGGISIPNDCAIGANSVVNKTFVNAGMMIAGIPAREIKKISMKDIRPNNY